MMGIGPERYDRNFNTLSPEDQKKLSGSRVAVVGLGGLGGGVCELLARIGVGQLTLIDGDVFDASNLNRQLLSREDLIGTPKARAALERVGAINSEVRARSIEAFADEENLFDMIRDADLVLDCLDSIHTRFILQDAARKAGIPLVSGAIAGVSGQVFVIFPGDRGYELIYGPRDEHRPGAGGKGIETITGNIAYCALLVASLQASEAVKVLLNRGKVLQNKLLIMDLWVNSFDIVELA